MSVFPLAHTSSQWALCSSSGGETLIWLQGTYSLLILTFYYSYALVFDCFVCCLSFYLSINGVYRSIYLANKYPWWTFALSYVWEMGVRGTTTCPPPPRSHSPPPGQPLCSCSGTSWWWSWRQWATCSLHSSPPQTLKLWFGPASLIP